MYLAFFSDFIIWPGARPAPCIEHLTNDISTLKETPIKSHNLAGEFDMFHLWNPVAKGQSGRQALIEFLDLAKEDMTSHKFMIFQNSGN